MKKGKQNATSFLENVGRDLEAAKAILSAASRIDKAKSMSQVREAIRPTEGAVELDKFAFNSLEEAKQFAYWLVVNAITRLGGRMRRELSWAGERAPRPSKIDAAFRSIGSTKVRLKDVAAEYKISPATLYQHKRLDKTGLPPIHIEGGSIWRER